jgi:hypothetical protein
MTLRSKFIPITLAAFCGLAFQLQANAANAQAIMGVPPLITGSINPQSNLQPGNSLFVGFAMRSYSGYLLALQQDGNLVLYSPGNSAVWQTNTWGAYPVALTMQMDCNLVLYGYPQGTSGSPQQLWASNTHGNGTLAPCVLYLDGFGALQIYQYAGASGLQLVSTLFSGFNP